MHDKLVLKQSLVFSLQLICVLIGLIIFVFSDPLNQEFQKFKYVQHLVPTKMYITRLLDPLKIKYDNLPSFFTTYSDDKRKWASAHAYLSENLYLETNDQVKQANFFSKIANSRVSPLTQTLLMLGCYGDVLRNAQLKSKDLNSVITNNETTILFNILLQTLEYNVESANDNSACSCLKDFASPSIGTVSDALDYKTGTRKKDDVIVHYDTCQSQNMQDYVLNGNYDEITEDLSQKQFISMATDYLAQTLPRQHRDDDPERIDRLLGQRNKQDPALIELHALENMILLKDVSAKIELAKTRKAESDYDLQKNLWINMTITANVSRQEVEEKSLYMQHNMYKTKENWTQHYVQAMNWTQTQTQHYLRSMLTLEDFPSIFDIMYSIFSNHINYARQNVNTDIHENQNLMQQDMRDEMFLVKLLAHMSSTHTLNTNDANQAIFMNHMQLSTYLSNSEYVDAKSLFKQPNVLTPAVVRNFRIGEVLLWLRIYIKNKMFAHNKLRAPLLSSDSDSSAYPLKINFRSYENYMQKYRQAYLTCSHSGIPMYQTQALIKVESTGFTRCGNAFLLASILTAFLYWKICTENINRTESISPDASATQTAQDIQNCWSKNKQVFNNFLWLVAFVWTLIVCIMVTLTMVDAYKNKLYVESKYTPDEIIQNLQKNQSSNWNTVIAFAWIYFIVWLLATFACIYTNFLHWKTQNYTESAKLSTQVVFDVGIIAAFVNQGIGIFLQTGFNNDNAVAFVVLAFSLATFLQHISNVVRLFQQYYLLQMEKGVYQLINKYEDFGNVSTWVRDLLDPNQPDRNGDFLVAQSKLLDPNAKLILSAEDAEHVKHIKKKMEEVAGKHIAYNRTVGIVVVLLILAGLGFAASETYDVLTYDILFNRAYMWIFLIFVFATLCGFDMLHEVANMVGSRIRLEEQHSQKLLWTAWIALLGLLVLKFYLFYGLCWYKTDFDALEGSEETKVCTFMSFLFDLKFYNRLN